MFANQIFGHRAATFERYVSHLNIKLLGQHGRNQRVFLATTGATHFPVLRAGFFYRHHVVFYRLNTRVRGNPKLKRVFSHACDWCELGYVNTETRLPQRRGVIAVQRCKDYVWVAFLISEITQCFCTRTPFFIDWQKRFGSKVILGNNALNKTG